MNIKEYMGHYYYHDDFRRLWIGGKKLSNGKISEPFKEITQEGIRTLIEKAVKANEYC